MESEKKIRTLEGIIIGGDVTFVTPDHFMRNCPTKQKQSRTGNYQNGNRRSNSAGNNYQGNDNTLIQ
jgi:hypothetical protein